MIVKESQKHGDIRRGVEPKTVATLIVASLEVALIIEPLAAIRTASTRSMLPEPLS
jgi:hypothetical protein